MNDGINSIRGEIEVKIGDLNLVLVPEFKKIRKVEHAIGKSFVQLAVDFSQKKFDLTLDQYVAVLFILASEPKPSVDKIGDSLMRYGFEHAIAPIAEIASLVFNGNNTDEEGKA